MQSAARPTSSFPPFVVLLPLAFLILGIVLRFLAFRTALPDVEVTRYFDELCRWDCGWYVRMAEEGYDPFPVPGRINAGNWAFFPLYPIFVGLMGKLIPLPTIILASIVSMLLSYLAVIVAWPLFERNLRAYGLYAAYILAGPFSFYFTSFMTETLFVLLTTWVFVALRRSAYIEAAVATSLLSATRIVGVFATLALVLQMALDYRRETGSWRGIIPTTLKRPVALFSIFLAPTGLFAYMAFLHWRIGDALAFSHVQRAWGREIGNPLFYFWQALTSVPDTGFWPTSPQVLAVAIFTGFALVAVLAWRRQWPAFLFALIAFGLPLFAGTASMLRFVAGMAPVAILAMQLLATWRWLTWFGFALLLAGCYLVSIAWMTGHVALV